MLINDIMVHAQMESKDMTNSGFKL